MSNKDLKEVAFIPFRMTSKKLSGILTDLQNLLNDPKSPKTFVTILTEKGFSLNVEFSERKRNEVLESMDKFRKFQRTKIGEEAKKEEPLPPSPPVFQPAGTITRMETSTTWTV
jgi:hypothetical protein